MKTVHLFAVYVRNREWQAWDYWDVRTSRERADHLAAVVFKREGLVTRVVQLTGHMDPP